MTKTSILFPIPSAFAETVWAADFQVVYHFADQTKIHHVNSCSERAPFTQKDTTVRWFALIDNPAERDRLSLVLNELSSYYVDSHRVAAGMKVKLSERIRILREKVKTESAEPVISWKFRGPLDWHKLNSDLWGANVKYAVVVANSKQIRIEQKSVLDGTVLVGEVGEYHFPDIFMRGSKFEVFAFNDLEKAKKFADSLLTR